MTGSTGLPPLLVIGLPLALLAVAVTLYPRLNLVARLPDLDPDQLAAIVIGVSATYLGILLALGLAWFGATFDTVLLALGFGLVGTALAARYPRTATTPGILQGAIGGLLAFLASNILILTATTPTPSLDATYESVLLTLIAAPAVLPIPYGHAHATTHTLTTPLRIAIVATPLIPAILIPATTPSGGSDLHTITFGTYLLATALLGILTYTIGWRLGSETVAK